MAEPIYKIDFTVDRAVPSVTPTDVQPAGYYGDDRVALVAFVLSKAVDGHRYRIEIVDGNGAYDITELLDAVDDVVSYTIPMAWTAAGIATLHLVEIELGEYGAETEVAHYPPARLLFNARDDSFPMEKMLPAWQKTLDEAELFLKTMEQKLTNGDFRGEKGDRGEAGPPGEKGEKGDKGDPGDGNMALMCQTFAGALTDRVTGPCVALTDVSPLPHNTIEQVRPHNHVQFPYLYETQTVNNVTVYAYTQPESGIEGEVVLYTDGAA
ncbi:MAG: collagen-like protein, partial [Clostridia bacterium]|nr:collagen-like protein [Clostridia bacterium]